MAGRIVGSSFDFDSSFANEVTADHEREISYEDRHDKSDAESEQKPQCM